ncbi:hypothetical protein EUGRSUZ_D01971 [Eucalyptus grandis]|uniref:Uncharacterized protein n=1 Tax=Eucalyptus grandis TaxID=71139 RepID=A0A059CHE8_EUCGR|nr:hypothetical protein EUGRSUZ_D01971 [Eucalyptus grandis]
MERIEDLDGLTTELEIAKTTRTRRAQKLEIQGGVVRRTAASLIHRRKSKEQSDVPVSLQNFSMERGRESS